MLYLGVARLSGWLQVQIFVSDRRIDLIEWNICVYRKTQWIEKVQSPEIEYVISVPFWTSNT